MTSDRHEARGPTLVVIVRAPKVQEVISLPCGTAGVVFGRDEVCDIVLPSPAVSRRHLSMHLHAGGMRLRDLSSHGTTINGVRLHGTSLDVGGTAELILGPYCVQLKLVGVGGRSAAVELPVAPSGQVSADLRRRLRACVLESLDLVSLDRARMDADSMRPAVVDALVRAAEDMRAELPRGAPLLALIEELTHEVLGLGPLEPLLADLEVSEIMVVDPETIYVERAGRLHLTSARFTDENAVRSVLERIVTPLGRRIDESNPMVDARLSDGSRVHAVIPPIAIKGPAITIRRFPTHPLSLERLVELGALSPEMASFLSRAVRVRVNTVIAGGTGAGKTTLLNVLSAAIPEGERVVTIEDAAELSLLQRHVVSLESRPPNLEGQGDITIRDLVRNALRMRPDRIVVGECRGGEALDMLQAMNTGHDGSMTTTHANSPREAIQRLETLCLMAGLELPLLAIRRQIAASVDLLVQQARFADGSRRITHVTEVAGVDDDGEVRLVDLFRYVPSALAAEGKRAGAFLATGAIPTFIDHFIAQGLLSDAGGIW
jgi:pilus assembly protein CpaF